MLKGRSLAAKKLLGAQPGTVLSPLAGLRAWLLQRNWIFQDLEVRVACSGQRLGILLVARCSIPPFQVLAREYIVQSSRSHLSGHSSVQPRDACGPSTAQAIGVCKTDSSFVFG